MRTKVHPGSCLLLVVNACAGYGCAGASTMSEEALNDTALVATPVIATAPEVATAPDAASAEPVLDEAAWRATWRRLPLPSVSSRLLVDIDWTPSGWLAVSSYDVDTYAGVGKPLPASLASVVYRSRDGTHWTRLPMPEGLTRASAAYGGGHYVITGEVAADTVVLDSVDGENWREQVLDDPPPSTVAYVRDRFYAMGFSLWSSLDGENWTRLAFPDTGTGAELQSGQRRSSPLTEIAFGNGQYLGVGLGTYLSPDGVDWQFSPIECATPDECEELSRRRADLPEGTIPELIRPSVFFAEGRYYVGHLSSADGHSWDVLPTPYPNRYAAGHPMTLDMFNGLAVWLPGSDAPRPIAAVEPDRFGSFPPDQPPDDVDLHWTDGLDCISARCLILPAQGYSRLYLVP